MKPTGFSYASERRRPFSSGQYPTRYPPTEPATLSPNRIRSVTVIAYKGKEGPCIDQKHAVVYRGPFREVVDDDGREVPPGTSGELWIGGPMVVAGYWDDPQATAVAFTVGAAGNAVATIGSRLSQSLAALRTSNSVIALIWPA